MIIMRFGRMKLDFNENNDNIDILEAIRTKEGLSADYDLETVKLAIRIQKVSGITYSVEDTYCTATFNGVKTCDVYADAPLVVNMEVKQCELSNPVNAIKSVLVDYEF